MNAEGTTHQHVLGSLSNFVIDFEQVSSLKGLEAEEVVIIIASVVNSGIDLVRIVHDVFVGSFTQQRGWSVCFVLEAVEKSSNLTDVATRSLVKCVNTDTVGQRSVVWVQNCQVGASLCNKLCNLFTCNT